MADYVYAPKMDANHKQIVEVYESLFCGVLDTHKWGLGIPDVLLHMSGWCGFREIKTEEGKLSPKQETFANGWRGPKIKVIRTMDEAIADVKDIRRKQAGADYEIPRR